MTINDIQDEIIEEFDMFSDWTEKYEYIIDFAKSLPIIREEFKLPENIIKGCQSQVWLHAEKKDDKLFFTADSDAIITKGLVGLMVRVLSGQKPEDIASANLYFIDSIGLKEHLSPTRSNGLLAMIKQMKMYAIAYSSDANIKA